jgi:Holliday junction resolvase RusA-like endonuclease
LLVSQRPKPVPGEYRLAVLIGPTRADIGNLEKGLSDLLQTHGVIENDRLCQGLSLERSNEIPSGLIRCTVMAAGEEAA